MKAHVICCNDNVESVFLGDEKDAEKALEKCAKTAYASERSFGYNSREDYTDIFYWHLHTVDLIQGKDITVDLIKEAIQNDIKEVIQKEINQRNQSKKS